MTDIDVTQDPQARTLTVTATFDAPPERVWQVWSDPRQLERWWGPPAYPATVLEHDLRPGGTVTYLMTGPEGDTPHGWWRVLAVDAPRSLELEDGFADADGRPDLSMPTTLMRVTLEADGDRTRMVVVSTFASAEAMEQLVAMGMVEGIREAAGQIPAILASPAPV
jgi:uncharacterized protein YndB with AHSA1/START domain